MPWHTLNVNNGYMCKWIEPYGRGYKPKTFSKSANAFRDLSFVYCRLTQYTVHTWTHCHCDCNTIETPANRMDIWQYKCIFHTVLLCIRSGADNNRYRKRGGFFLLNSRCLAGVNETAVNGCFQYIVGFAYEMILMYPEYRDANAN